MAPANPESGCGFRSAVRYEEYYLPGGDLFLMVDHYYFRVHRYFFERESAYFKRKLSTPTTPGNTRPGATESSAIILGDDGGPKFTAHEFARFLWVFYNPKYSLYYTTVDDWKSILALAHRWSFPEVKALAVRELERLHLPDIDRVIVYQEYDVDHSLLTRYYAALCERDEPLTPAEGHRMGIDTALTIAQLREMARRSPIDCRTPTSAYIRGDELYPLVRELFGIAAPIVEDGTTPFSPSVSSVAVGIVGSNSIGANDLTAIDTTSANRTVGANDNAAAIASGTSGHSAGAGTAGTAPGSDPASSVPGMSRPSANTNRAGTGQGSPAGGASPGFRSGNTNTANREGDEEKGKEAGNNFWPFGVAKTQRGGRRGGG